jgi:large subunit ribosomal protein L7/L12
LHQTRSFAAQATPPPDPSNDASSIGNEKVQKLAQELLNLTVLESSWLTEILRKKLNLQKPAYGAMPSIGFGAPMGGQPQMSAPAAAAPAAAAPPAPAEAKKEKADFDVKLESFSADGKIKVIKEIRAITNLGLKEAKELVC